MVLYITEMLRFGDLESHHYIVGVYSSKETAEFAGKVEASWRGGKYLHQVVACKLDAVSDTEKHNYHVSCLPFIKDTYED